MKIKKLLSGILIATMVTSGSVYVFGGNNNVEVSSSIETVDETDGWYVNPSLSRALLYNTEKFSGPDGHGISTSFATPSDNSNNINVYFKGTSGVTVTLQKKGLLGTWSTVDSFIPTAANNYFKEMTGAKGTTYRLKVDISTGANISGHLRANQL